MENYQNLNGNSDIQNFEILDEEITIQFANGEAYRYTYQSAGKDNIEEMKKLASSGKGLRNFINNEVKHFYHSRLD